MQRERDRCMKITAQYSFFEYEKCKCVSKTNVTNIPTPRFFLGGGGAFDTYMAHGYLGDEDGLFTTYQSFVVSSHTKPPGVVLLTTKFDCHFFFTEKKSLVQWWDKCFSFSSGYVKVRCPPSAVHLRCTQKRQNYFRCIRCVVPYLFTLHCTIKYLEYCRV
jgi:hypothetical protein